VQLEGGVIVWLWFKVVLPIIRRNRFNKIFGCLRGHRILIVCPSQKQSDDLPNVLTTYEDSMAQHIIQTQLVRHGIDAKFRLHRDIKPDEKSENLFLICGPVSNIITKEFLTEVNLPFRFKRPGVDSHDARNWLDTRDWVIANRRDRQAHPPIADGDIDYAIIARVNNPWSGPDDQKFVYLVAGIAGLGTWGAAYFLSSRPREVFRRLRKIQRLLVTQTLLDWLERRKGFLNRLLVSRILDQRSFRFKPNLCDDMNAYAMLIGGLTQ
jgi:hypothetical protein